MRFVPHEYQRYCTEYIKTHSIAALFLDMGLGKTVITLSAIKDLMLETFEVSKVLIIAPLRVARDTWPAEIEKWDHLKGLDISVIVGDVKTRIAAVHHPAMIYIVNRENIKWLVECYEKNGMRWDFKGQHEDRTFCSFCRSFPNSETNQLVSNSCRYCLGLRRSLNIAICLDFLSISVSRCSYFLPSRGIIDRIH